ncbi:hypothetical protein ABKN59_001161 [Abortiporus biennis]
MNGSSDIEQPTETTPLISRNGSSPTVLPSVDQYVEVVRSLALSTSTITSNTWLPETLEDEIVKLAFSFIVLLTVGDALQTYTRSSQDALGEWVDESRMLSAFRGVNEELIQPTHPAIFESSIFLCKRLWIWLKNQCTPRALHLLDLLYQSIYLGALVYYAIIPPTGLTEPTQTKPQLREYILLLCYPVYLPFLTLKITPTTSFYSHYL